MTEEEIAEELIKTKKIIRMYEEMLIKGDSGYPKANIKENIHYYTGRKHAFEYILRKSYGVV